MKLCFCVLHEAFWRSEPHLLQTKFFMFQFFWIKFFGVSGLWKTLIIKLFMHFTIYAHPLFIYTLLYRVVIYFKQHQAVSSDSEYPIHKIQEILFHTVFELTIFINHKIIGSFTFNILNLSLLWWNGMKWAVSLPFVIPMWKRPVRKSSNLTPVVCL